jgi:hypothetical protein
MKTHLIFCCGKACAQKEMSDLVNTHPPYQLKVKHPDTIFIGNERYFFLVDINRSPECIRGFLVDSFRTCSEYYLSDEILSYLASHTTANQPVHGTAKTSRQ